jgi:RHS repeat-associated protein
MGCLSLIHIENQSPLSVAHRENEVFSNSSTVSYRYGFNGMEKDDEHTQGKYDFGARIYDGRLGRWMSLDPLARKFPSISDFAFVANMPIWAIDPDGKDIIVLSYPSAVYGAGHAAVLIGNDKDGWSYYSKNGGGSSFGTSGESNDPNEGDFFKTLADFSESNWVTNPETEKEETIYTKGFRITTTKEQDETMKEEALKVVGENYYLYGASCIDLVSDVLESVDLESGRSLWDDIIPGKKVINSLPNNRYKRIVEDNVGEEVDEDLKSNFKKPSIAPSLNDADDSDDEVDIDDDIYGE